MKAISKRKKIVIYVSICTFIIVMCFCIYIAVGAYRMSLIPDMTFEEMLRYTTEGNKSAVITVGIIRNGEMTYTVYGEKARVLPQEEYIYEIGSITKTFTCSLLCKAISKGEIELADSVGKYLSLPKDKYFPTFEKIVTHTSGYKNYYFDWQMVKNFFNNQENDFYGISIEILNNEMLKHTIDDKEYPFEYSNFGISIIGSALSQIYNNEFSLIMNDFIKSDLKLDNTKILDGSGDLQGYWNWKSNDGYIPAGAIISTIRDMMKYVDLHMSESIPYLALGHDEIVKVNATKKQYEKMNIRMDSMGIGWIIDNQNGITWHNGGTSNFNSYAAFDKENQIGIVILSNLAPNYRVPATVMGTRLMIDLQSEYN